MPRKSQGHLYTSFPGFPDHFKLSFFDIRGSHIRGCSLFPVIGICKIMLMILFKTCGFGVDPCPKQWQNIRSENYNQNDPKRKTSFPDGDSYSCHVLI